jgi:hypothetical protein
MGTDAMSDGVLWMLRKHHEEKGGEPDLALFLFRQRDGVVDLTAMNAAYRELVAEGVLERVSGGVEPVICRDRVTGQNWFLTLYRLARRPGP